MLDHMQRAGAAKMSSGSSHRGSSRGVGDAGRWGTAVGAGSRGGVRGPGNSHRR